MSRFTENFTEDEQQVLEAALGTLSGVSDELLEYNEFEGAADVLADAYVIERWPAEEYGRDYYRRKAISSRQVGVKIRQAMYKLEKNRLVEAWKLLDELRYLVSDTPDEIPVQEDEVDAA